MWRSSLMCFAGYIVVAGLIVYGNDIRAGCSGAGVMGRRPSGTVHHSDKGSRYVSLATHSGLRKPDYWHQQEVLVTQRQRDGGGINGYKAEVITVRAGKTGQKWMATHVGGLV